MITSFIEMPELPNLGHMTKSTTQSESSDKTLLVTSWTKTMTSQRLFENTFTMRRPRGLF